MNRKRAILLGGIGVLVLALGIAIGVLASRPNAISGEAPASLSQSNPDAKRVLRDLLGSKSPTKQLPEVWASLNFMYQGVRHFVSFVALKPLNDHGALEDCHACAPQLAAVTYKFDAGGWSLSAANQDLGRFGSYGVPPRELKFSELPFGSALAVTFEDTDGGQGYTNTGRGVLSYNGNWRSLGFVLVAEDNNGTHECADDKQCWAWRGELSVGETMTNGIPDLVVSRQGTMKADDGSVSKAAPITLAYSGTGYDEKSKVEAAAAAIAARAASTISDGFPIRATQPVRSMGRQFSGELAWLNRLPFGASKDAVLKAIPSLSCSESKDGWICTSNMKTDLHTKCLEGIDKLCETLVMSFGPDGAMKHITVFYPFLNDDNDALPAFGRAMEAQVGGVVIQTNDNDPVKITSSKNYRWEFKRGSIDFGAHILPESGTRLFTLNIAIK